MDTLESNPDAPTFHLSCPTPPAATAPLGRARPTGGTTHTPHTPHTAHTAGRRAVRATVTLCISPGGMRTTGGTAGTARDLSAYLARRRRRALGMTTRKGTGHLSGGWSTARPLLRPLLPPRRQRAALQRMWRPRGGERARWERQVRTFLGQMRVRGGGPVARQGAVAAAGMGTRLHTQRRQPLKGTIAAEGRRAAAVCRR